MAFDRTVEFVSTIKSMEGKPQWIDNELRSRRNGNKWQLNGSHPMSSMRSQQYNNYVSFMRGSRSVARDLFSTFQKLEKINYLARKRTLFDGEESSKELNELIYIVRQDISSLNQQIESLREQQLQSLPQNQCKNIDSHSKNVVLTLQQQLATMSCNFKNTLQLRTHNMQQQKLRREQFTSSITPLASHSMSTVIDFSDNSMSSQNHNPSQQQQQQQLLIYEDESNEYLEERASTMQSIESTIVELGTIFSQLATMVHQQEEMITRIDTNVSDTSVNVDAAHESLLRYFANVTNNRWLILKVFGILFFFFIVFVLFAS